MHLEIKRRNFTIQSNTETYRGIEMGREGERNSKKGKIDEKYEKNLSRAFYFNFEFQLDETLQ
jgi:hypothetical protein